MTVQTPMSEKLQTALNSVLPDAVYPIVNTGGGTEYFVWNYSVIPTLWAESRPNAARYLVQAHYYCPHRKNPQATILAAERALVDAGFTWPSLTDASDEDGQHWVLECEYTDGGGMYGLI